MYSAGKKKRGGKSGAAQSSSPKHPLFDTPRVLILAGARNHGVPKQIAKSMKLEEEDDVQVGSQVGAEGE